MQGENYKFKIKSGGTGIKKTLRGKIEVTDEVIKGTLQMSNEKKNRKVKFHFVLLTSSSFISSGLCRLQMIRLWNFSTLNVLDTATDEKNNMKRAEPISEQKSIECQK